MSKRLLVKAVGWRLIALTISFVTCLIMTGKIELSLNVAIAVNVIKTVAYYFYDKLWESRKRS